MATGQTRFKEMSYPIWELDILPVETATDIHAHSSYTDGKLSLIESFEEAISNNLYEKGAIDHGNPIDEDIEHPATFLEEYDSYEEAPYTSSEIYPVKFDNIREILEDQSGGTTLNDADPEKLRDDLEIIQKAIQKDLSGLSISAYEEDDLMRYSLNYSMVVPHGIEIDYNPAIEASEEGEEFETVESYERAIIDFLKEAESLNSGYNYILGSTHYVNTPFEPRYVKSDSLFEQMSYEEKVDVLENYRKKELDKIESLASKLGDMAVPKPSGELMNAGEIEELDEFIYGQSSSIEGIVDEEFSNQDIVRVTGGSAEIEKPGVVVAGAHPTLIERNEELLDVFREKEGLKTKEGIKDELNEFMYNVSGIDEIPQETKTVPIHPDRLEKKEIEQFLDEEDQDKLYPRKALEKYYRPLVEASKNEDNFIFEINGKGVERQYPSVFWSMIDENLFGSDAHRPGEQPERSQKYYKNRIGNETVFLSEKWLSQLKKQNSVKNDQSYQKEYRHRNPENLLYKA